MPQSMVFTKFVAIKLADAPLVYLRSMILTGLEGKWRMISIAGTDILHQ